MKKSVCLWLVWLAVFGRPLFASGDRVDAYFAGELQKRRVPGMSIAVVRGGKIEKSKGYGLADVENNVPATERTVYQWASITKQFTAEAIMLLVQDRKLRLEDRLARYYTNAPATWSNVTICHLLSHTSGIKNFVELPVFRTDVRKDYTPDEFIGHIRDLPLDFQPGEESKYSNTGYYLLGLVIENVSSKSYRDFLASRIFAPLGMTTARLNHPFELILHRAAGYLNISNTLRRDEFVSVSQVFSAGGIVGTVLDLAKWDTALYTDKLLPVSVHERMWTPTKLNNGKAMPYGYGWRIGELRGHRFVAHAGRNPGFTTHILRLLDDKFTVIVLCNGLGNPESVARGIASLYIPGLTIATTEPQPDPNPALTKRLEQCLAELGETRDSEMLTPEFRQNFSRSRRRHANLVQDLKDKKSFTYITSDPPRPDRPHIVRLSYYRLATSTGVRIYQFALTSENRIAELGSEE
jgi:D-alanyl-D-alanine carboxypeptidase